MNEIQNKMLYNLVSHETTTNMEDGNKIYDFDPDQNFDNLKTSCLEALKNSDDKSQDEMLFKDDKFPPNAMSLNNTKDENNFSFQNITWKRASELVHNPKFIVDGATRFDINQGELGNCWVLASIASLTMKKKLFTKVVPNDQSFGEEDYAGIFHFRFWQADKWVDVVIDDYLPTLNGNLIFITSKAENEFWPALLEKAYAKLNGSYKAIDGGWPSRSLTDLTGGISEEYHLAERNPDDIFKIMMKAQKKSALMTCCTAVDPDVKENETPEGLITGKDIHHVTLNWIFVLIE